VSVLNPSATAAGVDPSCRGKSFFFTKDGRDEDVHMDIGDKILEIMREHSLLKRADGSQST
jgi:hypothetical protein